jgi:hypothetical protein
MSQETTTPGMTEVLDITNTYKVKGQIFTRKQRVSSFLTKHPEGVYLIKTREGQARVDNGVVTEGTVSTKSLVDKAFKFNL